MKVGILTYHFSNNYGALFQAYALRQWFLEQGIDAEFVNYHPGYVEEGEGLKPSTLFSKKGLRILFVKVMNLKERWFGNKKSKEGFQNFIKDKLGVNGPTYRNIQELNDANLYYDLLVCGSDQIWNPSGHEGLDPIYFLNFKTSNPSIKKISYAPSFGTDSFPSAQLDQLSTLISKLDAVSVREKYGEKLVERLSGRKPTLVPDPTVLLEDYTNIMQKYTVGKKEFIFNYNLRSRENIGETAEFIAREIGTALYTPHNSRRRWKEIGETVFPDPSQWLYLLYHSKFVVTNSFHGTMLSILLNKPFIVVGLQGNRAIYNDRALNLLTLCKLENRYIDSFNEKNIKKILNEDIDWISVNSALEALRSCGVDFLQKQLTNKN